MNHGGGLAYVMAALFFGGSVELMAHFDAEAVLRKLKYGDCSGIFMVPTHFHNIFELKPALLAECRDAPALKTIISNAAALPQPLKEKIIAYFGDGILHETYGFTEGGIISNIRPVDQLRKQSSVGTPFPYTEVKIVDANFKECAPDVVGELFSLSPYMFNGYWNKPEETEAAFRDGWVSVGDMARRDAEGYIYIVDRKKDMVISGGVNIYPREIEEVLFTHPAVAEAAVIGLPDEKWGERLKAFIVLRADARLSASDIVAYCEGKIANYKIPKDLAFLTALPRNANGKVLKTELRKIV
jgi:long-chain acyl-CoA synthetase